jgi:hypothetical protein
MNAADREGLSDLSEKIEALTNGLETLKYLGKPETVAALEDLVRVAPTLKKLADGYNAAGTVGGWFGKFIKWIASLAGVILALAAIWTLYFGDKP